MLKIAHRGNLYGADKEYENHPEYLWSAIKSGYDVEIDLWSIRGNFYFGHDEPTYPIDPVLMFQMAKNGWFHCKNFEALSILSKNFKFCNFFWHQEDDFTLTNNGYIWTYPGKEVGPQSILVDIDLTSRVDYDMLYGICSDFVGLLERN